MTRADFFAGLLLAAGCSAALWEASSFQYGSEFAPGTGFAPVWLSAIGVVLSLLIAGNAWRTVQSPQQPLADDTEALDGRGLLRVGATLIGLTAMLAITPWVGLLPALLAFLLFLTLGVQRLSLAAGIGVSVATVFFIYLVFVRFLAVPIPSGPLGF